MKKVKIVFIILISVALVLLAVQNTAPIQTRFLWLSAELPAVLLLFLTAIGGFIVGLLVALFMRKTPKSKS